jgi:hypothetical protein
LVVVVTGDVGIRLLGTGTDEVVDTGDIGGEGTGGAELSGCKARSRGRGVV